MIDLKTYIDTLEKKTVAVLGLGASGISCVRALVKAGAKVYAWDDSQEACAQGAEAGAEIVTLNAKTLGECDALIAAPGVPLNFPEPHPVILAAQDAEIEILGDIELFYRAAPDRKIIAVTGTNGKSTTVTLIHHILQECGVKAVLGGNIGTPVLDLKLPPKNGGVIVLELSSFQLDLCRKFTPDIGVLLNLSPDHIDRHGTMEAYAAIKEKIFNRFGRDGGGAVIGIDDPYSKEIFERLKIAQDRRIVPVSVQDTPQRGVYVAGNSLMDALDVDVSSASDSDSAINATTSTNTSTNTALEVGSLANITKLHGLHNYQNAAIAYAVARLLGLDSQAVLEAIKTFPGLAHRQFPLKVINGVAYINDSKATNADAAGKALASFRNIYWIVGGKPKDGGLKGLEVYKENIKHAFLIGEAREDFALWMDLNGIEHSDCGTLDKALAAAHALAQDQRGQPGGAGVVLLSPACASYDQFKSFEHRGDVFAQLVAALPDDDAAAQSDLVSATGGTR
ncbi:MAG: UDP-N-acetylmuramoyl-L-alanine--D-glutamate ligase [Alphaproteobacteria bacterium]